MPILPKVRDQIGGALAARVNIIYALQVCNCQFPLVRAPTTTQHSIGCPGHAHLMKRAEMEDVLAQMTAKKRRGRRRLRPLTLEEVKEALVAGAKESDAARRVQKRSPRR